MVAGRPPGALKSTSSVCSGSVPVNGNDVWVKPPPTVSTAREPYTDSSKSSPITTSKGCNRIARVCAGPHSSHGTATGGAECLAPHAARSVAPTPVYLASMASSVHCFTARVMFFPSSLRSMGTSPIPNMRIRSWGSGANGASDGACGMMGPLAIRVRRDVSGASGGRESVRTCCVPVWISQSDAPGVVRSRI
ncbi:hypothetical protein DENSPDRAFT_448646 [Dentipellis sp. KUC8613]|nr:hypothetical protein DENSPDRAFT_448646 [Dentipellis sp. KUC8613]